MFEVLLVAETELPTYIMVEWYGNDGYFLKFSNQILPISYYVCLVFYNSNMLIYFLKYKSYI